MQECLFSNHEVQTLILQNQAQIDHADLTQLAAGFHSLMEIVTIFSKFCTMYREHPQYCVYIHSCSLNVFLQIGSFLREMVKVKWVIYLVNRGYSLIWPKAKNNNKNHLLNQLLTILYLIRE